MASNSTKAELEKNISALPPAFTSDEIKSMYDNLVNDMDKLRREPGMDQKKMEMILQAKHKKFVFSYPSIFFKTVKNELNPEMLKKMLELKKELDSNKIDISYARNRIVDNAKADIEANPASSRKKKVSKPGEVVQEITVKCKPDDN